MNGIEHWQEAERLLSTVAVEVDDPQHFLAATVAQVHATLALAAATALGPSGMSDESETAAAWRDLTRTRRAR